MKIKNYLLSLLVVLAFVNVSAQEGGEPPENWFNLDLEKDSILGVSTERAYAELLTGRQSKTVIVAVIDDGVDYKHEDLKDVIWVNTNEVPGNGKDDDNNGYIDDVHGWNFIGGKNGNVGDDTYEVTRLYAELSKKFDTLNLKKLSKADKKQYKYYNEKVKPAFLELFYEAAYNANRFKQVMDAVDAIDKKISGDISVDKLKKYKAENEYEELAVKYLTIYMGFGMSAEDVKAQFEGIVEHYSNSVNTSFNVDFNPRPIVGDNYKDATERVYGNNDYKGPKGDHGSHVSGIIAAMRTNSVGIKGVADNVKIMIIRVVPNGDERDKDVANGIRYAVDNGATVVNMSFGKSFSYNKKVVDDAVRYAESKDVLLVHAAGNDANNTDEKDNFPTDKFEKKGTAKNWIEVGACYWKWGSEIPAPFSNYGKKNVDVFAPGMQINSTVPGSEYAAFDGTSMASPVTAGVCALIRSYFPELTAQQVKEIIMKSVTPVTIKVKVPGKKDEVKFKELCQSGGVVNAYKAVQLAMKTKGKKK